MSPTPSKLVSSWGLTQGAIGAFQHSQKVATSIETSMEMTTITINSEMAMSRSLATLRTATGVSCRLPATKVDYGSHLARVDWFLTLVYQNEESGHGTEDVPRISEAR